MVHRRDAFAVGRTSAERDRGATLVLFALVLTSLLIISGMAVDFGNKFQVRRQAQNAADAAALAAGNTLYNGATPDFPTAVTTVKTYAYSNFGVEPSAWTGCADGQALGYRPDNGNADTCISFDSSTAPTRVRVKLPARNVQMFFAQLIGQTSASVSASAVAEIRNNSGTAPCGLCLLSPSANPALSLQADGNVVVTANKIVINSSGSHAALLGANGGIVTDPSTPVCIVGNRSVQGSGNFNQPPITGCTTPANDPLSGLPTPTWSGKGPDVSGQTAIGPGSPSCTVSPSAGVCVYNNITVTSNMTMNPGLYIITGQLLDSSDGSVTANNATLFFSTTGSINFSGNGGLTVTSVTPGSACPTPWSGCTPYQGVGIYFDRTAVGTTKFVFQANGNLNVTGAVYAKGQKLDLKANGASLTLSSLVIADTANVSGNGGITVHYNKTQNPPISSAPPSLLQ
jgi:hypothetical protein